MDSKDFVMNDLYESLSPLPNEQPYNAFLDAQNEIKYMDIDGEAEDVADLELDIGDESIGDIVNEYEESKGGSKEEMLGGELIKKQTEEDMERENQETNTDPVANIVPM